MVEGAGQAAVDVRAMQYAPAFQLGAASGTSVHAAESGGAAGPRLRASHTRHLLNVGLLPHVPVWLARQAMADQMDLRARPIDPGEEALPLPSGSPVYESLTARFIDFERLRNTLAESGYSGYVRFLAPGSQGVVLLRNGKVVDTLHRRGPEILTGGAALAAIERQVADGSGVLDVVNLDSELVDGLHHLASGAPTYPDLRASWVNPEGLLRFLAQRHFTGAISVRADKGGGVIMLQDGEVTGAFTTESRVMGDDAAAVTALCQDPDAQIEVHAAGPRRAGEGFEPIEQRGEPVSISA